MDSVSLQQGVKVRYFKAGAASTMAARISAKVDRRDAQRSGVYNKGSFELKVSKGGDMIGRTWPARNWSATQIMDLRVRHRLWTSLAKKLPRRSVAKKNAIEICQ